MDGHKETTGYWTSKEEAIDRTVWRTRFGRRCGLRLQTDHSMNESPINVKSNRPIRPTSYWYETWPIKYKAQTALFKDPVRTAQ